MDMCDRCGKEFDYLSTNKEVRLTTVILHITTGEKANVFNLCSECQESLKDWIEKGVNE